MKNKYPGVMSINNKINMSDYIFGDEFCLRKALKLSYILYINAIK
jgi:hypothetical protein